MNEVQQFLTKWLSKSYRSIELTLKEEAERIGYDFSQIETGEISIVHRVNEADNSFTYSIKKGEDVNDIITVQFSQTGFAIGRHSKIITSV